MESFAAEDSNSQLFFFCNMFHNALPDALKTTRRFRRRRRPKRLEGDYFLTISSHLRTDLSQSCVNSIHDLRTFNTKSSREGLGAISCQPDSKPFHFSLLTSKALVSGRASAGRAPQSSPRARELMHGREGRRRLRSCGRGRRKGRRGELCLRPQVRGDMPN